MSWGAGSFPIHDLGAGDTCGFNLQKLLNHPVLECPLSCIHITLQVK